MQLARVRATGNPGVLDAPASAGHGPGNFEGNATAMTLRPLFATILLLAAVAATSSCATIRRDRCYLGETRYLGMKAIFEQTGSYQRVAQAMKDEQWADCEINSFRYRLRNDLGLAGKDFDALVAEIEPNSKQLDFNPGRVERVPK